MADYRYKAYISYSHQDEVWAKWIHRALESYRVPRKLVGVSASGSAVPSRIKPVFRDRADLSSASDLSSTVRQALIESENLIVVCSPDAADSHWVGEEIRVFAGLGRQQRIFCVIVDGDPGGTGPACFPRALEEAGLKEPLAADVRSWADGKRVARLKLIAGILGIRLDKLLQRDLQRRRKQRLVIALGMVAALALIVVTVVSQISRQNEYEKAEQMAGFIVELGETLQSDTDLETLATISAQATKHFQNLDADKLNAETGKKVALVIRQTARISQLQGRPAEAFEGFIESRDFFARLRQRYPHNADLLFESGNAEFYIGNLHVEQGKHGQAEQAFQAYYELTGKLLESDPGNPDWIMEMSYAHTNLAALDLNRGQGIDDETLAHLAEATLLAETAMKLMPDSEQLVSGYVDSLAWEADGQAQTCNLESAMLSRERIKEITYAAAQSDPDDRVNQEQYAFAISGIASLQIQLGRLDLAKHNLQLAVTMLKRLSAADRSNVLYRQEALYRQSLLAGLAAETGSLEAARSMFEDQESGFISESESAGQDKAFHDSYIDFLLAYADVETRLGSAASARGYLQRAQKLLTGFSTQPSIGSFDQERLMQLKYLWWELSPEAGLDLLPVAPVVQQSKDSGFRSCSLSDLMARVYIIEGDRDGAAQQVRYLNSKGYADPGFMRFCRKYDLCD